MRILMTADTLGGVWTYAIELAQALERHGVSVGLATMGRRLCDSQRAQAGELQNLIVFESEHRLEWMSDPWEDVARSGQWLLEIERIFKPDVVHLNSFAHGRLPFASPRLVVGHSCVLSWFEAVRGHAAPREWDRYREEVAAGLRGAEMVVAPSRVMLAALHRHYAPLPAAVTIYNARSPRMFYPAAGKENLLFSAGRLWDEAKNVAALQAVAPRLKWPLFVAGENRDSENRWLESGGLFMLGPVAPNAIASWLRRAAIFVEPARYEPFGLAILEAALSGCALVLGDIPSLREIWGDAAIFVPPDGVQSLESALNRLMRDPVMRHEMGRRALARAKRYSPAAQAREYLRVYRGMIRRQGAAAARDGAAAPVPSAVAAAEVR